jgi:hypothetical protein
MEVLDNEIKQEKEIKGTQIEKEKIKLSLFTGDTIVSVEYQWTLQKVAKIWFNKIEGFKIIIQNQSYFYELAITTINQNEIPIYNGIKKHEIF